MGEDAYCRRRERRRRRYTPEWLLLRSRVPCEMRVNEPSRRTRRTTACFLQLALAYLLVPLLSIQNGASRNYWKDVSHHTASSFDTAFQSPKRHSSLTTMPATTADRLLSLHLYRIQPTHTPKEISCLIKNLLARDADRSKTLHDSLPSRSVAERTLVADPSPDDEKSSQ